MRSNTLISVCH